MVKTEMLEEPKEEEENNEDMLNSDSSIAYNPVTSGMQGTFLWKITIIIWVVYKYLKMQ